MTKNIAEIVSRFSQVRLATADDNAEILRFLETQSMQTQDFAIGFDRGPDFFAFYRLASAHSETFLFLNEDRSIGGLGTLLIQNLEMKGVREQVGYFCDLRVDVKASSITHIQWRAFYAELVRDLKTLEDVTERCSFLYTSVFDTNERAIRALTKKLKKVSYVPFHAYQTQTVLMDPSARLRPDHTHWESAKEAAQLESASTKPDFSASWPTEVERPLVTVTSKTGAVLASCRPWRSDGLRQPKIGGMSKSLNLLGHIMPLLGRPTISEDTPLRQLFLTQLHFAAGLTSAEKDRALAQLVRGVYRQAVREKVHLLSWVEPTELEETAPSTKSKRFATDIRFQTSAKLYEVVSSEASPRAHEFAHAPLYFEGAIL